MRLIILAVPACLLAFPAQAEEPPQRDGMELCTLLAQRLDEAPGQGKEERAAHGRFLLSQCIAAACPGADAEAIFTQSKDYRTAWERAKTGCHPPTL